MLSEWGGGLCFLKRMIRLIAGIFSFAALSAIAAIAGVGLVVWLYDRDLPGHESLANYQPATLSRVYSGDGRLIAEFARERRIFVPIEEIPERVKQAFISAEDKNFYTHPGIDALGILRAMIANLKALQNGGGRLQGASTITQQVMKNFLLSSDRSFERKIKEAILSVRIEQALSKDQILELYLNEIFLGQNAYGVAAAAQRYFGRTLEDLSLAEVAYLAALPKAPSDLHPVRQRARATERRNYVLRQMYENGAITRAEMEGAIAEPLATLLDDSVTSELAPVAAPGYFSEEVRRQLSVQLGDDMLFEGGLTVRATIDPRLQAIAGTALRRQIEDWDRAQGGWRGPIAQLDNFDAGVWERRLAAADLPPRIDPWRRAVVLRVSAAGAEIGVEGGASGRIPFDDVRKWARPHLKGDALGRLPDSPSDVFAVGDVVHVARTDAPDVWSLRQAPEVQGALMAMSVDTGRVLALQGGFSYDQSVFNRATQAKRQPGSAFKPFVYAAALEKGYTPATIVLDAPIVVDAGGGLWKPQNSNGKFFGPVPMRLGIEMSRNLMTVRLAQEIGMDAVADYAERFGVYHNMPYHLSYALGAGETTLYQMVAAYATFANGGTRISPTLIDRIQDRRGVTIYRHAEQFCPDCTDVPLTREPPHPFRVADRIMDPVTAYQIVSMLRGVTTRGTASREFAKMDVPVAGKTGTTNDAKDVWFVGFTPEMAVGCYIGYDNPRSLGRHAFGGTLCAPVVAEFIREAYRDRKAGSFAPPQDAVIIPVDRWTGRPVAQGSGGEVVDEVFRAGTEPSDVGSGPVIGGGGFFFGGGADFPIALDEPAADEQRAEARDPDAAPATPQAARPQAPGSGFAAPGGLY